MEKLNLNEKRKYIYEKLNNLHDYNKLEIINDYIINNNISHTKNNNGIFINLSFLDEKYINYIYNILILETKNIEINNETKIIIKNENEKIKSKNKYINLSLNNLELLILSYS